MRGQWEVCQRSPKISVVKTAAILLHKDRNSVELKGGACWPCGALDVSYSVSFVLIALIILADIEVYIWLILFNSWLRNCQYMLPAFFSLTSSISAKHVKVDQSKPLVGRDPCGRVLPGEKASALVKVWQMGQHLLTGFPSREGYAQEGLGGARPKYMTVCW